MPPQETCNPSKHWKPATAYIIGVTIAIKVVSFVKILAKNDGNEAKNIPQNTINPTDKTTPVIEYFFTSIKFLAPFANPTLTAIAFEIESGITKDAVLITFKTFCAAAYTLSTRPIRIAIELKVMNSKLTATEIGKPTFNNDE